MHSITKHFNFKKNQIIFSENQEAKGFFAIKKGKIKIFKLSYEGKEKTLQIFGASQIFGEVPVFQGKNYPASSMAIEDAKVIFFAKNKFLQLIENIPELGTNLLACLSEKLRKLTTQIEDLSLKEAPARLASYIITLSKEQSDKNIVILPISKVQVASLIGTTPETISRAFKKMMESKLIKIKDKSIFIKNIEKLINLSNTGKSF